MLSHKNWLVGWLVPILLYGYANACVTSKNVQQEMEDDDDDEK